MRLKNHFPLLALFAAAVLASFAVACNSNTDQPNASPTPSAEATLTQTPTAHAVIGFASVSIHEKELGTLSRVDIIPSHPVIIAGETMVFSALAYDASGKTLPAEELDVQWRTTDPLAGSITDAGIFHAGVQRGVFDKAIEVSVTHGAGGQAVTIQQLASVSIIRPLSENDISRIQVLPSVIQAEPGAAVLLTTIAVDRAGIPVPGVEYIYEVLDPKAGVIDAEGRFTAGSSQGSFPAAIRVVAQKQDDPTQAAVTFVPVTIQEIGDIQPPSKVNLYPQAISVRPGDTIAFRALALDPLGNLVEDVETSWKLNDPSAGALDSTGAFRAGATPGTYRDVIEVAVTPLEAESPTPLRATATVTVLDTAPAIERLQSLVIRPQVIRLHPGESRQLSVTALSSFGEKLNTAQISWSANPEAVSLAPDGLITAGEKPGTYPDAVMVIVSSGEGDERIRLTTTATVIVLGALDRIDIIPEEVMLTPGQVVQFSFIAYDTNGVRLFDVEANWEVLDPQVGDIDGLGFFVAGSAIGQYEDVIKLTVSPRGVNASGP